MTVTGALAKSPGKVGCATIYFHGQPGSADELALFERAAPSGWFAPDRSPGISRLAYTAYFDGIADQIRAYSFDQPVKLVGFSIGAYVALEVAARLSDLELSIDLVSPAAPLSTGPYLETMAGKMVFVLARGHPRLFKAVSMVQGIIARIFPGKLCDLLFASAQGGDATLYSDPLFRGKMQRLVQRGLGHNNAAYRHEIAGYVGDWAPVLRNVDQPVTIWQGQRDNWSPPAMAENLAALLPCVVTVHRLGGCSHYSTLREYLRSSA